MRYLFLLTVSFLTLGMCSISAADEAVTEPAPDNSEAFKSMGYAMASQLRLNIGFSEEELNAVFEGMRMAALGESQPEGFQQAIQQAQQIYMQRMQDFQQQEQERAAEVATTNKAEATEFFATLDTKEGVQKTASGLYYEILSEGTGNSPVSGDRVKVNYKGVLIDGREFDANDGANFMVDRVVPGFSEGLKLAKEGGKIKLYVPSELGYGDSPSRPGSVIEPGDALIFEVELLEVSSPPKPPSGPPPQLPANLKPPPPPPTSAPGQMPTSRPPTGVPPVTPPSGPPPSPAPSTIPSPSQG